MRYPSVASVMTTDLVTATPDTPLPALARLLADHHLSAVPVVTDRGVLIGEVSELDLMRGNEFRHQRRPWSLPDWARRHRRAHRPGRTAADLMRTPARTIHPETDLDEAARLLADPGIRRVHVVDKARRLTGVLSRRDVLQPHLRPDAELARTIDTDILRRVLWALPGQAQVSVCKGVVTLSGALAEPGDTGLVLWLCEALPGVVAVVNRLDHQVRRAR